MSAAVLCSGVAAFSSAQENADCLACHTEGIMGAVKVDAKSFRSSAHSNNTCVACHTDMSELPHPEKPAPVSCKSCHPIQTRIYAASDHGMAVGRGVTEAAACKDCHGRSHTLLKSRHPDSPVNRKNIAKTCARCHDDPKRMMKFQLSEREPFKSYSHTIHGKAFEQGKVNAAVCTDCHGSHDLHSSDSDTSRIFWKNVPDTCGRCHSNILTVYRESIHGQAARAGIKDTPVCTSCHGEHTIDSIRDTASSAWVGAITRTCSGCHASERLTTKFGLPTHRLKSYMDTYHGLASKRGDLHVANCASCHGFHDILPHTDPRSSIHSSNIAKTCGKCHPGATIQLAKGSIHGSPTEKHWSLKLAYLFYVIAIPLTIGGMLFHNGLDFLRKLLRPGEHSSHGHLEHDLRMTVNERIQHGILTITFCTLAYTGFALKYPEAWWAIPMVFAEENLRRSIHRWTALLFCILGIYHMVYLVAFRRGRSVLFDLLPRWRDVPETLQSMMHKMWIRRSAPRLSTPYNYIEKMEYWALLWGSIVMVVTGGLLVFPNITLRYFPLWVSDLATMVHFYEAVLACMAIFVWHSYWTIFDPDVYPMNWAWLTGRVNRQLKAPKS